MPKNPNPTSKTTRPSFQNDVASVTSPLADVAVNETEGCIRSGPKIRFGLEMLLQILNWFRSVKVTALLLLLFSSALLRLFFPCSFSSRRWCSFGEEGHKPCSAALLLGAGSGQHGRMKLETESLKDVKCNDGKEKEKIVDSANSNFNSGNDRTFHPIKKFVMQSYFDRHIELHDSVFDNFMSQEDNVGLCQVLPKNHDFVPRLSVLKRELIGEGSHRHVSTLLKFQARRSESSSQLLSSSCDFIIIERLPTGVFADPFELQRLVQRGVFNDVDVFGDTNLELPSFLSNRSAVEIHLVVDPNKFLEPTDIKIELPLHARYQPLNESGYSTVELGMPDILVRCSTKERSENQNYFFKLTNNDADVMYEADVLWRIPSGKKAHSNLVFVITFSIALLSTLVIFLSSLEYSKSRVRKDSKQS